MSEFKIGDKVTIQHYGILQGLSQDSNGIIARVEYRDQNDRYLGQAFVPLEFLQSAEAFHERN